MNRPYDPYPKTLRKADLEAKARRTRQKLQQQFAGTQPIVISGRKVATSFWGQAWCDHLESIADYSNRLPRGRSYVRGGAVVDLQILPGLVKAKVQGTRLYRIEIQIAPCLPSRWKNIVKNCAGSIDSVVALLQGKVAPSVIAHLIDQEHGLFPSPADMRMSCSCPDWAVLCKHVAAAFYGVGARLDQAPELFFLLRQVDQDDLFATAAVPFAGNPDAPVEISEDLSALFDITFDAGPALVEAPKDLPKQLRASTEETPTRRKATAKKPVNPPAANSNFDLTPRSTLTKQELLAAGLSKRLIERWIEGGILRTTRTPDSFRTTRQTFEVLRVALAHS